MAENSIGGNGSIFGENFALPSTPDITSPCETKLLQLLKHVDLLLDNKHENFKKELEELNLKLEGMKKENKDLREIIRAKNGELESMQRQHSEEQQRLQNEIKNLQQQINVNNSEETELKVCNLCQEKDKAHEAEIEKLKACIDDLKEKKLKFNEQLGKKTKQNIYLVECCRNLQKTLSKQAVEVKERKAKQLKTLSEKLEEAKTHCGNLFRQNNEAEIKLFEEDLKKLSENVKQKVDNAVKEKAIHMNNFIL